MTDKAQNEMEAVVTRALEQRQEPLVPADFAARVMRSLPAQKVARPKMRVGRVTAMVAAVVLTVAVFAIAPHASLSFASLSFDLELVMLAELAGIAYWFVARRDA